MNDSTIIIDQVFKTYGKMDALHNVSLNVEPGQCVALLGHNGAGKTTLMKSLLGLTRPTSGTISVLGETPGVMAIEARKKIGYLPENVRFHEAMTGTEILKFYARLKDVDLAGNNVLLERVGLLEAADRRVKTYSKGMKQRLGLAQALLGTPRMLLLDEPTSGLDPLLRMSFYEIIRELQNEGTTIFLSSHALTELEARTDRVAIMRDGKLVADNSLANLRRSAGLSVRIRVVVTEKERGQVLENEFSEHEKVAPFNGKTLEISCEEETKVDMVRRVLQIGCDIEDIEIIPPSLDEIYSFYGRKEGPTS